MKVVVLNSIDEIEAKKWDKIVDRNRLICSHRFLQAIEKSEINDCKYYYPVVYDGEEIIAHTCTYTISTEMDIFATGFVKKIINIIRKVWKGFFIMKSIECGTPIALGNLFSFKTGVDKTQILSLINTTIEKIAKQARVHFILYRDFYNHELSLFDSFLKYGYTRVHNLQGAKLSIEWANFDEYINSMKSHYRSKVVRHIKRFNHDDVHCDIRNNFSDYSADLAKLWRFSYDNAKEYKRELLSKVFFEELDSKLGKKSALILVKKGNIPIGFSLLLYDEETLIPLFCGLDYRYNEQHSVYFILFYKAIELAIMHGLKDVDMGITTLTPKKQMGGVVVTHYMYMKSLIPFLKTILPKLYDLMTPQESNLSSNVFKTK